MRYIESFWGKSGKGCNGEMGIRLMREECEGKVSGDLAQMVERSLSMREALGSIPRFSTFFIFSHRPDYEYSRHSQLPSCNMDRNRRSFVKSGSFKSLRQFSGNLLRQKSIEDFRASSGWTTNSQATPVSVDHKSVVPELRSKLAQTISTPQRESVRLKEMPIYISTKTSNTPTGWSGHSLRHSLIQSLKKGFRPQLFDLHEPKSDVKTVPALRSFFLSKNRSHMSGGGFRTNTSRLEPERCKCCERMETLHSHPIFGDIRITSALSAGANVKSS